MADQAEDSNVATDTSDVVGTTGRALRPSDRALAISMGQKIRRARIQAGLSQDAVARAIGIGHAEGISSYERGKRFPKPSHLVGLARHLNLSLDALFDLNAIQPSSAEIVDLKKDGSFSEAIQSLEGPSLRNCYELPATTGSLLGLPEFRAAMYRARHPRTWEANHAQILEAEELRRSMWQKHRWHAYVVLSHDFLEALALGVGAYKAVPLELRRKQLHHLQAARKQNPFSCSIRVNRRGARQGIRIYDQSAATFTTIRSYIVIRDRLVVARIVDEFTNAWDQSRVLEEVLEQYIEASQ